MKKQTKSKLNGFKSRIQTSRYSPISMLENEKKRTIYEAGTGKVKITLSKNQAFTIALMAIAAVFLSALAKLMIIMRFSTFPNSSIFYTWHPWTAILGILSALLYIYCLSKKGINYWLAYFPAFMAITYCVIEYAMIHGVWAPQDLANFFSMLGMDNIPEWLTGPRI